jgi:hypothetical protein
MTMPLVQLGPGGDYIRRIVPSDDRLQSVTRPFSLTDSYGRLVSRPNAASSTSGPIAWLLTALHAIGLIQLRTAASPAPTRRPPCPRPSLASDAVGSAFRPGPPGSFRSRPVIRSLQCTQRTKRSSNESSAWTESRSVRMHSVATELRSPPLFNRRDAPNPRSNRPAWSCSTPRRRFRPRPYPRTARPLPLAADLPDFSPPSRWRDSGR